MKELPFSSADWLIFQTRYERRIKEINTGLYAMGSLLFLIIILLFIFLMKMESGLIKQPISIIKNVLILSLPLYFLFYGFLFLEEKRLLRKDFQIKIKEEDEGVIQKKRIGDIWDFPSAIMGVIPTQTPRFYLNNKQIVVTIDLYSQFKEGEKIKLEYAKYSEIVFNIVKI